jgi:hypothetical protein
MKATRLVLAAAAVAVAAGAAWAGGCGSGCSNKCPLAQAANERRSYGKEGGPACEALADQILKNLSKV